MNRDRLHHAVEDAHKLIGAVGHWDQFAPGASFSYAEGMLPQNMCPNVVCGANDQNREDARIGVDRLNRCRVVNHDSVSLH